MWITPFDADTSAVTIFSDDLRIVDHHTPDRVDRQLGTFNRHNFGLFARNVVGHDPARHNMIGQNFDKLGFVFRLQKAPDGTLRQFSKGGVGRRENGKGSLTLQCIYQTSCLDRSDKRIELARASSPVDNIL